MSQTDLTAPDAAALTVPAPEPTIQPALDDLDGDSGFTPDVPGAESASEAAAPKAARTSNRALIRRVALKAQEVLDSDAVTRSMAAALIGAPSDSMTDLTIAIMCAGRSSTQSIDDLKRIAASDPFEAAQVAEALGRDRMRAVWMLLDAFDSAPASKIPASNPKAALALAKHVLQKVNIDSLTADLDAVLTLLKRY